MSDNIDRSVQRLLAIEQTLTHQKIQFAMRMKIADLEHAKGGKFDHAKYIEVSKMWLEFVENLDFDNILAKWYETVKAEIE